MRTLTPSQEIIDQALHDESLIPRWERWCGHFGDPNANRKYCEAMAVALAVGYVELGNGQGRRAFDMGDGYVLKIPRGSYGEKQNVLEAQEYAAPNILKHWPLASAELVDFNGVTALRMEKVEYKPYSVDWEEIWRQGGRRPTDGANQTGLRKDGTPVIYDYAHDIMFPTLAPGE